MVLYVFGDEHSHNRSEIVTGLSFLEYELEMYSGQSKEWFTYTIILFIFLWSTFEMVDIVKIFHVRTFLRDGNVNNVDFYLKKFSIELHIQ